MQDEQQPAAEQLPWVIASALLAILTITVLWYPVRRAFAHFEINYNEGWNAYRAKMAANGVPLYGAPPAYTATNYPPVSFHLIGALGRLNGDVLAIGRYVSLAALAAISILITLIVRKLGAHWHASACAGLTFLIWLAVFQGDRIGMDDPQMLAMAIGLSGLFAYVSRRDSAAWLCVSGAVFALSIFTKHNLLSFPFAVGAHLSLKGSLRRFALWTGSFAICTGALWLLTLHFDGPYFWTHMSAPRPYSIVSAFSKTSRYALTFQVPVLVALLWSIRNFATGLRMLLSIAFAAAHVLAVGFSGGFGVDGSIFFDCMVSVCMIAAIAACDLTPYLLRQRFGVLMFTVALVALLGVVPLLPGQIYSDYEEARAMSTLEGEFGEAVSFIASRPGPALCNDLLLCFEAGKPEDVDTFAVEAALGVGRMSDEDLLQLVRTGHFSTIQVPASGQTLPAPDPTLRRFMDQVMQSYRVGLRTHRYGILKPNPD